MGPTQVSLPVNILTATPQQTHPRSGVIFYYLVFPEKRESLLVFKGPAWHGTGSNLNQTLIEKFPVLICIIFLSLKIFYLQPQNNLISVFNYSNIGPPKNRLFPFGLSAFVFVLNLLWLLFRMFALFQLFKLNLSEPAEN